MAYCFVGEEGPEDVHASLAEVSCLTVVLVAQGHQVEQLRKTEGGGGGGKREVGGDRRGKDGDRDVKIR